MMGYAAFLAGDRSRRGEEEDERRLTLSASSRRRLQPMVRSSSWKWPLARRFLLRNAVEGAETPNQFSAVDADNAAAGKLALKDFNGFGVARVPICRDGDQSIGDVKVRVAGGKTAALVFQATGHRQFNDAERPALRVACGAEQFEILPERGVVRVVRIGLDDGHKGRRTHEAREVIDVSVGVVAFDAVAKPENLPYAQKIAQVTFDVTRGQLRIAIGIEQAGFRRQ